MKKTMWLAVTVLLLSVGVQARTYSTSFPLTENPISENGYWINGGVVGGTTLWGNVQTHPGLAFGVNEPNQYGDPTAVLAGTWGMDQVVTGVVGVSSTPSGCCHEAQLRARTTIQQNSIAGYELLCSVSDTNIQLVRWNGANGNFTVMAESGPNQGTNTPCRDGDTLVFSVVGPQSNTQLSVTRNGQAVTFNLESNGQNTQVVVDTNGFTSGGTGMGFYDNQDSNWSWFGWKTFTATDGQQTGDLPQITQQPQTVAVGQPATFSVTATGADSYQWQKNGGTIADAVATSYTTPATVQADNGSIFSVALTNAAGTIQSNGAQLAVTGGGGGFAPQLIQAVAATPAGNNSSAQVQLPQAQMAGDVNLVVLAWSQKTGTVQSLTDTMGNPYTLVVGPVRINGGGGVTQYIYKASNLVSAAGGQNTVRAVMSQTVHYPDLRVLTYRGILGTVLGTQSSTGISSSTASGKYTLAQTQALLVGGNTVWSATTAAGTGWTSRIITEDGDIVEDKTAQAAGQYTATAPLNSSGAWVMSLVALQ